MACRFVFYWLSIDLLPFYLLPFYFYLFFSFSNSISFFLSYSSVSIMMSLTDHAIENMQTQFICLILKRSCQRIDSSKGHAKKAIFIVYSLDFTLYRRKQSIIDYGVMFLLQYHDVTDCRKYHPRRKNHTHKCIYQSHNEQRKMQSHFRIHCRDFVPLT